MNFTHWRHCSWSENHAFEFLENRLHS